jgi:ankyrin repeat protein
MSAPNTEWKTETPDGITSTGVKINRLHQRHLDFGLLAAATMADYPALRRALERGANPTTVGTGRSTGALYRLSARWCEAPSRWMDDRIACARLLLDAGAHPDGVKEGCAPLIAATTNRLSVVARMLVQAGANVHLRSVDDQATPLYYAVRDTDYDLVRVLLDYGADTEDITHDGRSAIDVASSMHDRKMLAFLAGARRLRDIDVSGVVTRVVARANRRTNVSPDEIDRRLNNSALLFAARAGLYASVEHAFDHGANPNANSVDLPPLHSAFAYSTEGNKDEKLRIAELLVQRGANVNMRNDIGEAVLLSACEEGWPEAVLCLLDHGASPLRLDPHDSSIADVAFHAQNTGAGCDAIRGIVRERFPDLVMDWWLGQRPAEN